jgi:hypothetical protein
VAEVICSVVLTGDASGERPTSAGHEGSEPSTAAVGEPEEVAVEALL